MQHTSHIPIAVTRNLTLLTGLCGVAFGLMLSLVGLFSGPVVLSMGVVYLTLGIYFGLVSHYLSDERPGVIWLSLVVNVVLSAVAGTATGFILLHEHELVSAIYHGGLAIWFSCLGYMTFLCWDKSRNAKMGN